MKRLLLAVCAAALLQVGVSAQTSTVSSAELDEAQKLNAEVVKLFNAGKYDEAIPLAKRILQIREKTVAPNNEPLNSALINLAELYRMKRKYGDAEGYYQRLLTIYEQASSPDAPAIARILDRLAYLKYMQFSFDKAEKLYQRALALREQSLGADNLEVATSLFNLAEFYRFRENYLKAEPLYQRAIEIKGKALGAENEDVVKSLERYSCLYYAMNQPERWKDARSQFSFLRQEKDDVEDEEILNGKAISLPKPEYPRGAMPARLNGIVIIKVWIDETGKVTKAVDVCGQHPVLGSASMAAAYKARFTPTLRSGKPVPVTGVITYRFTAN